MIGYVSKLCREIAAELSCFFSYDPLILRLSAVPRAADREPAV